MLTLNETQVQELNRIIDATPFAAAVPFVQFFQKVQQDAAPKEAPLVEAEPA
jgi:hypothetical protein